MNASVATQSRISRIGPRSAGITLTPAEFDAIRHWDRSYRYELIRGVLVVAPVAGNAELDPNQELGHLLLLYQYNDPRGSVIDKTLPEQTISTLENRRRADRFIWIGLGRTPEAGIDVPAIIIEFVSASRRDWRRDYEEKRDEYLALGVREYWVIDRFARTMTVFKPGPEGPTTTVIAETESYQTDLLPGFSLPLARLMAKADAWPAKKRRPPKPPAEGLPEMVKIRRAYEVLALGLFLFFLIITDLRYLRGWPVSLFLEATPLVAVSTALTTHTLYRNLVWGLVVIAITMMLGRVWCNWMCPFGILHHFFGWIGNRRNTKQMIEVNRYRKIYAIKYYILAAMIAMASLWIVPTVLDAPGAMAEAFGRRGGNAKIGLVFVAANRLLLLSLVVMGVAALVRYLDWSASWLNRKYGKFTPGTGLLTAAFVAYAIAFVAGGPGTIVRSMGEGLSNAAEEHKRSNSTLQIGLLDPIALTVRSLTTSVLPTVHKASEGVYTEPREYMWGWIVGVIFVGLLVANWWIPRFFCRVLCPLGALLGVFSRFALWRIDRDPVRCTDCDLCLKSCEGASDPQADLRKSECFVCLNCIEDCPHDALLFRFLPRKASEVAYPNVGRRQLMMAGLFGVLFFPMVRLSGGVRKNFSPKVIRPPGSVNEDEFLRRCIKCDQCIRVCPTNVLQPAMFEAGLEGLWTPIMISKMGWCELNCTLCSQVCPTGAIREISIAEKLGTGPFESHGPIKTGTAFYNQGRCLPWAMDTSCVVCEEVCPVSPKAIFTRNVEIVSRWGETLELKRPFIDPDRCIGCGICEHECPVKDDPAVYVTAIGETRDKSRSLLLGLVEDPAMMEHFTV